MTTKSPPDRRKEIAAAAAALLLLERQAIHSLRGTLSAAVPVIVGLGLSRYQGVSLIERTQERAIESVRLRARARSGASFAEQTKLVTVPTAAEVEELDSFAARNAAKSLAQQWTEYVAAQKDADPYRTAGKRDVYEAPVTDAQAFKAASEDLASSIDRTAITETYGAWNEEWRRQAEEHGDVDVVLEWNAESDACPRCWRMHGLTVRPDETFTSGDPPLHPNCRCRLNSFVLQ